MLFVTGRYNLAGIAKEHPNAAAFTQVGRNWMVFDTLTNKAKWDKNHTFGYKLYF